MYESPWAGVYNNTKLFSFKPNVITLFSKWIFAVKMEKNINFYFTLKVKSVIKYQKMQNFWLTKISIWKFTKLLPLKKKETFIQV